MLRLLFLGKYLKADVVEIFSDVDGIYDKDPKKYDDAILITDMTYNELLTINAKILHSKVAGILKDTDIKLYIKNTNNDKRGTLVQRH